MKKIKIIIFLVITVIIFAGCSKKENSRKKIIFWQTMNLEETQTLEEITQEFRTANPDVEIEMQPVPFTDAQSKYSLAATAEDAPDVFRCEIAWTAEFAENKYLLEIENMITPDDMSDYLPIAMNYNKINGHIYGLPQVTDCLALLYNKRIFKEAGVEPPADMNEFITIGQKLTDSKSGKWGFYMRGDSYWLQPFIWAFDGDLITADKVYKIDSAESVKALKFVLDFLNSGKISPKQIDFSNDYTNAMTAFKSGKTAMIFNGPWATSDILTGEEFKNADNLGIAIIPKEKKYGSPVGGHNYVISKTTKNKELAYKFISFLNKKENQIKFAKKNNLLPTRLSAYNSEELKNNRIIQDFLKQLKVATNRPVLPIAGKKGFYDEFTRNYQAAWNGELTAEQALLKVKESWMKIK